MRRGVLATIVGLALVSVTAAVGVWRQPHGRPLQARRVVIIGMPGLAFDDLSPRDGRAPAAPRIRALADRGALAAMNVRTVSPRPSPQEAYATLGAGGRVDADGIAIAVAGWDEPVEGSTGADALALRTDLRIDRGVGVIGATALGDRARDRRALGDPGALGARLARDGRTAAVVAAAGTGATSPTRAVALAAMDARGWIPDAVIVAGPVAAAEVLGASARADVVIADATVPAGPGRAAALARADDLVDTVARGAPPGTLVIVAAVTPPTARWQLTPVVAWHAGMTPAALTSTTTKRAGLVTLADVGTTAVAALGSGRPGGMRTVAPLPFGRLDALRRDALARGRAYAPITAVYVTLQALVYLAALVLHRGGRSVRPLLPLAAAVAAFPLATYAARLGQLWTPAAAIPAGGVTLAVAVVLCTRARDALASIGWLLAITVAVILGDLAFGAPLETASLFGYSPDTASRFYGIGNSAMALVLTGSLLSAGIALVRRRLTVAGAAALLAAVTLVCALPTLGAKVGAMVTILPVVALAAWRWAGRIPARAVAAGAAVAAAIVGAVVAVDLLLAPAAETHLAATLRRTRGTGWSSLADAVARRVTLTAGYATANIWTELILVIAAGALLAAVAGRPWSRLLPPGSPLRVAVIAGLAGGLWGVIANDSGSSVIAIAFVFIGPALVALAAMASDDERRTDLGRRG